MFNLIIRRLLADVNHRLQHLEITMTKQFDDVQVSLVELRQGVADVAGAIRDLAGQLAERDSPEAVEAVAMEMHDLATQLEALAGKTPVADEPPADVPPAEQPA